MRRLRRLEGLGRRIGLLALLLVLGGAGVASAQVTGAELARQQMAQGHYAEAIATLTRELQQHPDDIALLLLRAEAHERRGQLEHAVADYQHVLHLRPGQATAQARLETLRRLAAAQRAGTLETLRRHVAADPQNLSLRLLLAEALQRAGLLEEAAEHYRHYVTQIQATPDVVTSFLVVLAALPDHRAGAAVAERYLQIYPSSDDLWMRLGHFRLWQGQYVPAQDAFRQALRLNPRNAPAQRGLADTERRIAAVRAAPPHRSAVVARLERQLARDTLRHDVRFQLIDELIALERYVEAFGHLQVLAATFAETERWQARFRRVDRALRADAPVYRIDRLAFRLRLQPDDLETRYALAHALQAVARYAEAEALLQEAPKRADVDEQRHERELARARAAHIRHLHEQARLLRARLAADPGDLDATRALAEHLIILSDVGALPDAGEALALLERYLAQRPDDHEARFQLARLLTQARRPREALEHARHALAGAPDDPHRLAQYLYAAAELQPTPPEAFPTAQRARQAAPDDVGVLLALATFYTAAAEHDPEHLDRAEKYIQLAERASAAEHEILARREVIAAVRRYLPLPAARRLASDARYNEAAQTIKDYYRTTGIAMPRVAMIELAHLRAATGDYAAAAELLARAQQEAFDADVQLIRARYLLDARAYDAAIDAVEVLLDREPARADAHMLRGDALREMHRIQEAEAAYRSALAVGDPAAQAQAQARLEHLHVLARGHRGAAMLFAPRGDLIWAGGDGIEYRRVARGLETHVALPADAPVTLTATYLGHGISGTDVIRPAMARPVPSYTVEQLDGGVIIELARISHQ